MHYKNKITGKEVVIYNWRGVLRWLKCRGITATPEIRLATLLLYKNASFDLIALGICCACYSEVFSSS